MANPEHLAILEQGVLAWNRWRKENPQITPDLEEADLGGERQKEGGIIVRPNLSGVNFEGANLKEANLGNANLEGANLSKAHLMLANLERAVLNLANLRQANLHKAILTKAVSSRADFERANLSEANMEGVALDNSDFASAELVGANLIDADLRDSYFGEAKLSEANLLRAYLVDANFVKADLEWTNFTEATLEDANFTEANLWNANLREALISGANFAKADLEGANLRFAYISEDTNFESANLEKVTFSRLSDLNEDNVDIHEIRGIRFANLAFTNGLETAEFGDEQFLQQFLQEAFAYAHNPDPSDAAFDPHILENLMAYCRLLYPLFISPEPPTELFDTVRLTIEEIQKSNRSHNYSEIISAIFGKKNWDIQCTKVTRDNSCGIFAIGKDVGTGEHSSFIIECQKYPQTGRVEMDIIDTLYGMKFDLKDANLLLATTSHLSGSSEDKKPSCYNLERKDYESLLEWVNTFQPHPNGKLSLQDNKLVVPWEE